MSRLGRRAQPGELRYRKTGACGRSRSGLIYEDLSGTKQVAKLHSDYTSGRIQFEEFDAKLGLALAKEEKEWSLADELANLPRPFPTNAVPYDPGNPFNLDLYDDGRVRPVIRKR